MFEVLKAVIWKDILMEYKTKQMTSAMLIFSGLVIVIFSFAFNFSYDTLTQIFPGMIWIALIFSSLLGLNRSFLLEKNNDCMQGLLLLPGDRTVIYWGKLIANFLFVILTQIVIIPGFFLLFDFRFQGNLGLLILVLFVGTLGFIAIGTFLAAITSHSRMSDMLLPIILFPVSVPLIIAGVQCSNMIFAGQGFAAFNQWFYLMLVFDAIFLTLPYMLFDYVMEV